jgi:hypothetical protein
MTAYDDFSFVSVDDLAAEALSFRSSECWKSQQAMGGGDARRFSIPALSARSMNRTGLFMSFNPPVVYRLCRDCLHKTVTSANTGNVIHRAINLFSFINESCQPSDRVALDPLRLTPLCCWTNCCASAPGSANASLTCRCAAETLPTLSSNDGSQFDDLIYFFLRLELASVSRTSELSPMLAACRFTR